MLSTLRGLRHQEAVRHQKCCLKRLLLNHNNTKNGLLLDTKAIEIYLHFNRIREHNVCKQNEKNSRPIVSPSRASPEDQGNGGLNTSRLKYKLKVNVIDNPFSMAAAVETSAV